MEFIKIAVIDYSEPNLYLYSVPTTLNSEETEWYINEKGHKLSQCSWGEFNDIINKINN